MRSLGGRVSGARFAWMPCSTEVRAEALKRAIVASGGGTTNVAQRARLRERLFDPESDGVSANANEACVE